MNTSTNLTKMIVILVHSGVSELNRTATTRSPAIEATISAAKAGYSLLLQQKTAVDAVEGAVNVMESSGVNNAGKGSVRQTDGRQRMDASIMDDKLNCGSVASLRGFENPISVARWIMDRQDGHIFFAEDIVAQMARARGGFKEIPVDQELQIINENSKVKSGFNSPHPLGNTVGAVALDFSGSLAAGTSTGGRGHCAPGRIGDSPIIGAGTYCNRFAAVSNTGHGEWIVKLTCAKRIVDLVQFSGLPPQVAVDTMGREYHTSCDKTLGSICVDAQGHWGIVITGQSMGWALIVKSEQQTPKLLYGCARGECMEEKL